MDRGHGDAMMHWSMCLANTTESKALFVHGHNEGKQIVYLVCIMHIKLCDRMGQKVLVNVKTIQHIPRKIYVNWLCFALLLLR